MSDTPTRRFETGIGVHNLLDKRQRGLCRLLAFSTRLNFKIGHFSTVYSTVE
jgi:hypothetical protein